MKQACAPLPSLLVSLEHKRKNHESELREIGRCCIIKGFKARFDWANIHQIWMWVHPMKSWQLVPVSPEHKIHKLKPFPSEESLPIGWQHQAGAQSIEKVLHHFLFLGCGRVVTFKYLRREAKEKCAEKGEETRSAVFMLDKKEIH